MASTRVLIADDHVVFRMGLRSLVHGEPDMDLCAEAANGMEAIDLYRQILPDAVIMDLRMPHANGVEAIGQLVREFPHARILVLSSYAVEEEVYKAMQAGARGYLLKNSSRDEILAAIRSVAAGQFYLDPAIAAYLAERDPKQTLTSRELEVVQLMVKGLINKEIATVLSMSENTVKTHIKQIFWKLDVTDRTEAVSAALRRGLSSLDEL